MSLAWSPQASVMPSWRSPASRFSPVSPPSSWSLPRRPSSPSCGSRRALPSTRSAMSDHTTTRGTSAKVVAGSLLGGIASAIALVAVPFAGGSEATITGAILLGFAVGWALLAMLSTRLGDGTHRWAAVPAAALGLGGTGLTILTPSTQTLDTLGWIWPPLLLGLVIWMAAQTRRLP